MYAMNTILSEPSVLVLIAFIQSDGSDTERGLDGLLRHGMKFLKDPAERAEISNMLISERHRVVRILDSVRPSSVDVHHAIREVRDSGPAAMTELVHGLRLIVGPDPVVSPGRRAFVQGLSAGEPMFRACMRRASLHHW